MTQPTCERCTRPLADQADIGEGWLAVRERPDNEHDHRYPWFPALEIGGSSYPLPVWFATEDECEQFIRDRVIGRGLLQ